LFALSQTAAREFLAYNIRVYTLCPEEAALRPITSADNLADTAKKVTDLAVFLCSSEAAHLPGQVFQVSRQE
jgi:NAD(P)-dependent dehydrogenase (short-subunit alcohol dehydrogenase family)